MINVLYFASLRETLGTGSSQLDYKVGLTVESVIAALIKQGDRWESALSGQLLCSVNQEMVAMDAPLADGDEVALFPPVTGG